MIPEVVVEALYKAEKSLENRVPLVVRAMGWLFLTVLKKGHKGGHALERSTRRGSTRV